MCALMGGLDYRASPDWAASSSATRPQALAEANLQSIEFLRELAAEYADDIDDDPGRRASSALAATPTSATW